MTSEEIVKTLAENTQRSKSNSHRIDELSGHFEALNKMATALEVLATKQLGMSEQIDKIEAKVSFLEATPMKRVQTILGYALAALCSAAAGAFFGGYI
ncbi:MAG: hypothetical protein IJY39_09035 [Clostridia bacterium]|nr:hypothetical protein [Clostridia bacterium]